METTQAAATLRVTGTAVIAYAEQSEFEVSLCHYNTPIEDAREDVTPAEAKKIASDDPQLVYVDIAVDHLVWRTEDEDDIETGDDGEFYAVTPNGERVEITREQAEGLKPVWGRGSAGCHHGIVGRARAVGLGSVGGRSGGL